MELLRFLDIKWIICFVTFLFIGGMLQAQCDDVEQGQPSIMVVPWTKLEEDILVKIENDENYRSMISVIKASFVERDFNTEDFTTEYEQLKIDNIISNSKMTQEDVIKQVIENSKADIVIKAEVRIKQGTIGSYVEVELSADFASTGMNLANLPAAEAQSPQFKTKNYTKLVYKALHDKGGLDKFLNKMNRSFSNIREKGQVISIRIEVGEYSEIDLDEEMDSDYNLLSDLITDWIEDNAYKNNFRTKGSNSNLLYFDEVRIPLRDENCRNYDSRKFERPLRKYINSILKSNANTSEYTVKKGSSISNKIYFIIQKKQ